MEPGSSVTCNLPSLARLILRYSYPAVILRDEKHSVTERVTDLLKEIGAPTDVPLPSEPESKSW